MSFTVGQLVKFRTGFAITYFGLSLLGVLVAAVLKRWRL